MYRKRRALKTTHQFPVTTLIIFGLCFAISTLGYSEVDPAITIERVVRYGFPMTWLKATTLILPPSPTQYTVLWFELFVNIIFYLALSLGISFIILKTTQHREEPVKSSLWARVLLVILVAYPTRLLSCGIHELLGHGLWAWIFGADRVWFHVSWLGFGWCTWDPPLGDVARVMAMAGGLINTFIIGAAILTFLFLVNKKGGSYLRLFLFWLGFWTTINQAGYLLLGGFTSQGDPSSLHSLTGIPLGFFMLLGFGLFLVVYLATSVLFLSEVSSLFPEYRQKTLLFEFWITIPIQVIFLMISPEHRMSFEMFFFLLALSMIPSLLSLPLFQFFNHRRLKKEKG